MNEENKPLNFDENELGLLLNTSKWYFDNVNWKCSWKCLLLHLLGQYIRWENEMHIIMTQTAAIEKTFLMERNY